jgi:16S rRNA (uracil1498-N3)-methyltransferase
VSDLFFVSPGMVRRGRAVFSRLESRHIRRSCRRGPGDVIRATDGRGSLLAIEIDRADDVVEGRVVERRDVPPGRLTIHVAAGVGKRERMSWLVEKGTEIGMTAFHPLITDWSAARRDRTRWDAPLERWRRVAVAALKQSGRFHLPEIFPPEPLDRFLERARGLGCDRRILLDRGPGSRPFEELLEEKDRRHLVVVGPEGGFTPDEVTRIAGEGFELGRLIDRPLRFETAGVSALALIAARSGGAHRDGGKEG